MITTVVNLVPKQNVSTGILIGLHEVHHDKIPRIRTT